MNWGQIPKLANHFMAAAQNLSLADTAQMAAEKAVSVGSNVWAALSRKEALGPPGQMLHLAEFTLLSAGTLASIVTGNFLAATSFVAAEIREVYDLNKIGQTWRSAYPDQKRSTGPKVKY